jgi:hypothetical protein
MLKALLASALLTTIAAPSSAAWLNQHGVTIYESQDLPFTHRRLFRALDRANVTLVDGHDWELCIPNEVSYLAGFYVPSLEFIVLCTESPEPDLMGTLVHESVHAVQDCRAGQDNSTMHHMADQYMINGLEQDELDTIKQFYPQDQYMDEVEARFLDQYPNYVADQLDTYCL